MNHDKSDDPFVLIQYQLFCISSTLKIVWILGIKIVVVYFQYLFVGSELYKKSPDLRTKLSFYSYLGQAKLSVASSLLDQLKTEFESAPTCARLALPASEVWLCCDGADSINLLSYLNQTCGVKYGFWMLPTLCLLCSTTTRVEGL